MQMDVYAQPFKLTPAIEKHLADRIMRAFGTSTHHVRGVMVRLSNIKGVRGSVNKSCRIVVWLRRGGTVVAEGVGRDLYHTITVAAEKLRTSIVQRQNRRRTLRRQYAPRRFMFPFDERRPPTRLWTN